MRNVGRYNTNSFGGHMNTPGPYATRTYNARRL